MSGIRRNGRQQRVTSASAPYNRNKRNNNNNNNITTNRLYVGNLSYDTTWQELKDYFKNQDIGKVIRADIIEDHNGRSRGCGIIEFDNSASAQEAINLLNNTDLNGRTIFVREDRESNNNRVTNNDNDVQQGKLGVSRFVYVGNLSYEVKWQDLKDHMKSAGEVIHADVLEEGNSGRSKGCGVVEFASIEDANRAIQQLNNTELKGRLIFVREDREREGVTSHVSEAEGCRLYVGNLAWDVRWQDLKDHFKPIGKVIRADVMMEGRGDRSKGWGIVEYSSPEEAQQAIEQLNDTQLHDRPIHVREDREAGGKR